METTIAYGTKSKPKMEAALAAVGRIGLPIRIVGANTKTGEMEQPLGRFGDPAPLAEGKAGSFTRATEALLAVPEAEYGLGIESQLLEIDLASYLDLAVVCLLKRGAPIDRGAIYTTSVGIGCPSAYVRESLAYGRRATAGKFFAAANPGVAHDDWHLRVTGGRISRADLLADAISAALAMAFPSR